MKKHTRTILIFALIAVLCVPSLLLFGGCDKTYVYNGIHYTIYDDHAEVNYFISDVEALVCEVPSHVEYEGEVYPVTEVRPYYPWGDRYNFVEGRGYVAEIILPKTVTEFAYNEFCDYKDYGNGDFGRLERITVHPDNEVYSDVNGVLFSKDKTELLYYPYSRPNNDFTFPKETTSIAKDSQVVGKQNFATNQG